MFHWRFGSQYSDDANIKCLSVYFPKELINTNFATFIDA